MMFSRRPTYSERASSNTSDLLSEGIAANSKLSRLLTAELSGISCLSQWLMSGAVASATA
jgi:hypothetical protein